MWKSYHQLHRSIYYHREQSSVLFKQSPDICFCRPLSVSETGPVDGQQLVFLVDYAGCLYLHSLYAPAFPRTFKFLPCVCVTLTTFNSTEGEMKSMGKQKHYRHAIVPLAQAHYWIHTSLFHSNHHVTVPSSSITALLSTYLMFIIPRHNIGPSIVKLCLSMVWYGRTLTAILEYV